MRNVKSCAVYVATCDRYMDLWPGFFFCWNKYWPDCPFEVYLGANQSVWPKPGVVSLRSGLSTTWSERIAGHLLALPHEHIVFFLEDFYLRRPVDTKAILDLLSYLKQVDGVMLRLIPRPPPQNVEDTNPLVGECLDGSPYRVCAQVAIWRREVLLGLLRKDEDIWQFEHRSQARAGAVKGRFYSVTRDVMPYRGLVFHHVVEKGRWIPCEYWRCRWKGIPCDKSARRLLAPFDFILLLMSEAFNRLLAELFGGRAYLVRENVRTYIPRALLKYWHRLRKYQ